jgi:hypothetical protein
MSVKMFWEKGAQYGDKVLLFERGEHVAGELDHHVIVVSHEINFIKYRFTDISDEFYAVARIEQKLICEGCYGCFSFTGSDGDHFSFVMIEEELCLSLYFIMYGLNFWEVRNTGGFENDVICCQSLEVIFVGGLIQNADLLRKDTMV